MSKIIIRVEQRGHYEILEETEVDLCFTISF